MSNKEINDSFNDQFTIRGYNKYRNNIKKAIKKNPEKYTSQSHYVRVALINQLKKDIINFKEVDIYADED